MSVQTTISIKDLQDIASLRRKLYEVSFQLTSSQQVSSRIASDVSESLKKIQQKIQSFQLEIYFDRQQEVKFIQLQALLPNNIVGLIDCLAAIGFVSKSAAGQDDLIKASKSYQLNNVIDDAASDKEISQILSAKSREQLFAEIEEQQDSLQTILDTSPVSIGFRVGAIYQYVNTMFNQQYGIEVGDSIDDIYADPQQCKILQDKLAQQGFLSNEEAVFKNKQGQHRLSVFTILPMHYNGQQGFMLWIRDITEQKQAEEAIVKAKNAAEEATRAKSDFLANMSHEIRTPMNAIIGMSHLALQGEMAKKERSYIEKVHRAGENLLGIINDILDFSKIEAGKLLMENIDFDLDEVMDNVANLIGMKAEEKNLEILFDIKQDVPALLIGDPLRLGQILINLGNNAVKFTERGEVIFTIEKISQHQQQIELSFSVKDSGIGMNQSQCNKLFQSFSQADSSTTRKYGGTGLGLVISKNLVEQMGGQISVSSEPNKGSVFSFTAKLGLQKQQKTKLAIDVQALSKLNILVVDDNAPAREVLVSSLKGLCKQVDEASDGLQACQQVAKMADTQAYDFVLMDWQMPVLDGIEAAKQISAMPQAPKIIMVTSFGRADVLDELEKQNFSLYHILTKPVTQASIVKALTTGLQNNGDGKVSEVSELTNKIDKLRDKQVLLVEDNQMNQELAIALLEQAGMVVTLAENGQQALDILKPNPSKFDCVLMDCQMPVMDGYTATRELRKLPEFANLPIIAMTANAMIGDKEKVLEAGMWDHISKPLNVKVMLETIAKHMPSSSSAQKNPTHDPLNPPAASTATEPFAGLVGIDIASGLASTMNNQALYMRMLEMFYQSQSDFGQQFVNACADPDSSAPMRLAHTLKGNAGNIGAKAVQQVADLLEQACKDKASAAQISELVKRVEDELAPVLLSVATLLNNKTANTENANGLDREQFNEKIQQLRHLLNESDSNATDFVNALLDEVQGAQWAKQWARELDTIKRHIEKYDFDIALECLDKIQR